MRAKASLRLASAREVASQPQALAEQIGIPIDKWVNRCHEVSLALLKTGAFGSGRIARGWANGVVGQHSWIVLSDDVYDPSSVIVDATHPSFHRLYELSGGKTPILVTEGAAERSHRPHGSGSRIEAGPPECGDGEPLWLTPQAELSDEAQDFLSLCGPLDRRGWANLANGPMRDWPAGEIIAAMDDTPEVAALVPIDILGMVTPRNPNGLYLASDEEPA